MAAYENKPGKGETARPSARAQIFWRKQPALDHNSNGDAFQTKNDAAADDERRSAQTGALIDADVTDARPAKIHIMNHSSGAKRQRRSRDVGAVLSSAPAPLLLPRSRQLNTN